MLVNSIIHWFVGYLFATIVLGSDSTGLQRANLIFGTVTVLWLAEQIIGFRLSPILFPRMCVTEDNKLAFGGFLLYCLFMYIIALAVALCHFYFFNYILYDLFLIELLGAMPDSDSYAFRPYYLYTLFLGEMYNIWTGVEAKAGRKFFSGLILPLTHGSPEKQIYTEHHDLNASETGGSMRGTPFEVKMESNMHSMASKGQKHLSISNNTNMQPLGETQQMVGVGSTVVGVDLGQNQSTMM